MLASAATTINARRFARKEFVISRALDAPRDLVWKAWTQGERLAQWWGPKGCKIRVLKLEVRPGGTFRYSMEYQAGRPMWGRFIYREIVAPERIAFVVSFTDMHGEIIRAPIRDNWPLEVLNTVSLSEKNGQTTLTLRVSPIDPTEAEYQAFLEMFDSLAQGYGGTMDQLTDYLARAKT
jgi:uncharacterized protein YndB with AHSA1/START domain